MSSSAFRSAILAAFSLLAVLATTLSALTETAPTTGTTAPAAPTLTTVTPGNGVVVVAFSAPSSDGGSAITGYTVTASPGGATATGANSPLVVGGLTNDTAYTFTVTATNAVGTGAASAASAAATPRLVSQQAYVKAVNTGAGDNFGHAVAMSGSTLVVGAPNEASNAVGVNGDTLNNSLNGAGAVYVFTRSGTTWTQQAYLKASNTGEQDQFGAAVAIAGETIVVGAPREASSALGVNGNQADNTTAGAGAAYVFVRSGTTWTQQAYLKASNTGADDLFGTAVAIAGDTVVVGAYQEDSNATGVNGTQSDNSAGNAGAAYVFTRSGTTWTQQAYLKASNTQAGDRFGQAVALSGETLAIGADGEDSNATGANGTQSDNSAGSSGAVYIFTRSGADWTQQAYLKASNTQTDDAFGRAVALAGDLLVVGADGEDSAATGANGNQADNLANGSGAAYVFTRTGTTWTQQAYLKASNPDRDDRFGYAVAVSGEKIIVGAFYEASTASGINGNQADNSVLYTGAAYVFQRSGTAWTQQAYVKASNSTNATFFGTAVTLSGDTAVVGATRENSSAVLVGGNQSDTGASSSGAAYVFLVPTAPPAVTTPTSASVAATTATLGGNLVSGGGAAITERGIVYALTSANAAPRIGGTGVTKVAASGTATGVFTTGVTDLVGNRAYTFAAYATNSAGTAYSDVGTFTTPAGAPSAPTITSVVGGDGLVVVTFTPPANDNGSPITGYTVSFHNGGAASTVTGTSSPIVVGGLNNNTGSYYFFTVAATNALGTGPASAFSDAVKPSPTAPQAYLKAGNTGAGDQFGAALALSGDTLVVGAPEEDSAATGVNGDAADNSAAGSGAVYVFTRSGTTWTQQAYLKASNTDAGDKFGTAVAVSGDTLVVGAPDEASAATAIGGDAADNTAAGAGAAYIFTRSGTTWTQQAYLKASNTGAGDSFGATVGISGDTVVVGAAREASAATGIGGDQADNTATDAGAVYVFTRSGTTWTQQAYLKASNTGVGDSFGHAVAVAGETVIVGARSEASAATGVNGNQADNTATAAGAAYVFTRSGTTWSQQAYLKASNTGANDQFGYSVAVSGDTVVIGANAEASDANAVDGNQADNAAPNAGAAYVFTRTGTTWTQQAYLKADNSDGNDRFGWSVAIADDSVVVGAWGEASRANGVNSVNANNNTASGAAYRFQRAGTTWTQQAYIKATNTGDSDNFGRAVAASGLTLVIGANNEDSAATGVGGNQADNTAANAGAVYAYTFFYGPTVSAPVSPTVAATTATLGGTVASDGALRERGIVYARTATNAAPQIGGTGVTKVVATGTAVGDFTATVTGLTASTGYSYAAYAINGVGTAYSPVATFTTAADVPSAPTAVVAASGNGFAVVQFSAPASDGGAAITSYTVTASPGGATATGTGSPVVVGGLTNGTAYTFTVTATNSTGSSAASGASAAVTPALDNQQAYLKASNTTINAVFGGAVALSGDTLVVGSVGEDTTASNSGAVYVFTRSNATWKQEAFLKAAVAGSGDLFGSSVAISGDTLVVGAYGENSGGADSGAAYIFTRSGTTWTQQALLKASNPGANDFFGYAVGISGDTVIVGAPQEGSSATGVDGAQANESAPYAGAAYVFTRSGMTWSQQAYVKASNTGEYDQFGYAVALSGDTAVVGAWREDSPGTGVNGEQASNSLSDAGSAYIFTRSGTTWAQQAYLKASQPGAEDYFGKTVAISGDTVVIGAHQEDSAATGANGDATDNSRINAGAAYVFTRSGAAWTQQAYLKASNPGPSDNFGASVAVSGDVIAIGAWGEASGFGGFGGNQTDDSALSAGATYVWTRSGTTWTQRAYLKASAARGGDQFGSAVAVSAGGTVAATSPLEPSAATGINGNPFNASAQGSGAAFVFLVPVAPAVSAPTATAVAPSTATLGGELTADNGAAVTERGIVYAPIATNAAPRIGGTGVVKVAATGTSTGTFTVTATGLTSSTSYSYSAYATNAVGTAYSSVATFNTAPPPETVTVNGTELASATDLSGNLGTVTSGPVVYTGRVLSSDTSDSIQLSLPAGQTITAATATITNFSLGGGTTPIPGQLSVAGTSTAFSANGNVTLSIPGTITSPLTVSVTAPSSQMMMPGIPPLNITTFSTFTGTADYVITLTLGAANPTVASVTVPAAGTKKLGETLDFTVNWSTAVTVVTTGGTPTLGLTVGSTARTASYVSGTGTTATVFRYTVQAGDLDTDGLTVGTLALNGGTLKDANANDAVLTLASVGATSALNVDGIAPVVTAARIALSGATGLNGYFKIGDSVTATWNNTASGDNNADLGSVSVNFSAFGGGTAVVATNAAGTWTATSAISVNGTNLNVILTATDTAGNATPRTGTNNASALSTLPPRGELPTLAAASDSGTVGDRVTRVTTPTLTGSGQAGLTVRLYDTNQTTLLGTATVASGGTWSITTTALTPGAHTLYTQFVDVAGNTGPLSPLPPQSSLYGGFTGIYIDTTVAAPVITGLADDTGTSATDGITKDTTLILNGTAEAFATVTLSKGGNAIGTATASSTGAWSFDYTGTTLGAGEHSFTATATDIAGNVSSTSATKLVTIDTTIDTPVIAAISTDTGTSATDGITSDSTLILTGTAETGSTVTVLRNGLGSIGTATANGSGAWSFDYTATTLAEGAYLFTATATDAAGNVSASSADFPVTIDTTAPAILTFPANGTHGTAFSYTISATGSAVSYTATPLPAGLTLDAATGLISGTPTAAGATTVALTATDTAGNTGTASLTITIAKATPVITWPTPATITYGAALSATELNATATIPGTFIYTPALGTTPSAGTPTLSVAFTPTDTANYTSVPATTVTLNVAQRTLTLTGFTVANKVYDGTPTTTFSLTGATLTNRFGTDDVTVVSTGATAQFGAKTPDATAGTAKPVFLSGLTLGGTTAPNYILSTPSATADITPKPLTVSGLSATSRTYNGTTAATITGTPQLVGVVSPDVVTVSGTPTGTFANANVGGAKSVAVTGLALGGTSAANYTLTPPTLTASITPASASIALTNLAQTYDGKPKSVTVSVTPAVSTTLVYSNAGGAAPTNAGSYLVTATVADNNYSGGANATLVIAKASQAVTFAAPAGAPAVGTALALTATASSGLPITFSVVSGAATLSGSSVTLTAGGSAVLRATQAGDDNTLPASAELTLTAAAKLAQTITFPALPNRTITDASFGLGATASSGLPVSFAIVSGPAILSGTTVIQTGATGVVTIRASQAGNATFAAAPDVVRTFAITSPVPDTFFGDLVDDPGLFGEAFVPAGSRTVAAKSGDIAAVFYPASRTGSVLIVAPSLSLNVSLDFALTAADTYTVSFTSAGRSLQLTGALNGSTLTGRLAALRVGFSTPVQSRTGNTATIAGFYQSNTLNDATGGTTTIVGPNGQLLIVAATSAVTTGAVGTVASDGTFRLTAADTTIAGVIDPATTALTGTIAVANQAPVSFSGVSSAIARTDRLINLSSRVRLAADRTLITGFVIGGTASKRVLLRAVGPALTGFGVPGALVNPKLTLFNAAGATLLENDDWSGPDTAAAFAQTGAFALTAGARDAALVTTLAPGAYTMQVTAGSESGAGLAEIYDASPSAATDTQRLVNLSTRGTVEPGTDGLLIGGFVVTGNTPKRVLIRGIGPTLGAFGVAGTLADPRLAVFSGSTLVAQNDDWSTPTPLNAQQTAATAAELTAAAQTVGAFALGAGAKDSAILVTLAPGAYTAQVSATTTGTALVEIYEVP